MDRKPRLGDTLVEMRVMRDPANFYDFSVYVTERTVGGDNLVYTASGDRGDRIKIEPGQMCPPTFTIPQDMAGDLVGQLLKMGVTPEGKAAPQDLLDAKDAHLKDLRALVFKGKV